MRFLTDNIGWKLLSLLAAFFIWVNVASEPELSTILSAPVEYKNYPKDLEISSGIVESIDVEAHGPAGLLRELTDSRLAAIVDFGSVRSAGERTFTLTSAEVKLPRGIQLIRIIPAQLRFDFEHRLTRSIPVEVPLSGALGPGLKLLGETVTPASLGIAGPQSHVEAVDKASSDPVDLSTIAATTTQVVSVYIGEPQVRFVNTPQVTVSIRVAKTQ